MAEGDAKLWELEQISTPLPGNFLINKSLLVCPVNSLLISTEIACKPTSSNIQPTVRHTRIN